MPLLSPRLPYNKAVARLRASHLMSCSNGGYNPMRVNSTFSDKRLRNKRRGVLRLSMMAVMLFTTSLLSSCLPNFALELTGGADHKVLQNLIVDFEPYDDTRYAGAFD